MNIQWNARQYHDDFSFVPRYGEEVLDLLTVPAGSRVIDLGCGSGTLTKKLAERGYQTTGIDSSPDMIGLARAEHPELNFLHADAESFTLPEPADAIFSNAVFHWIDADRQERMLANIASQLRTGGELVCEFGGFGCAEAVHSALEQIFPEYGLTYRRSFYFPTIGQYAPLLERQGLRVELALLFDRPTPQKPGSGVREWIEMFLTKPFEGVEEKTKDLILRETEDRLRGRLLVNGTWFIDYVRIRFRARRTS